MMCRLDSKTYIFTDKKCCKPVKPVIPYSRRPYKENPLLTRIAFMKKKYIPKFNVAIYLTFVSCKWRFI